MEQLIKRDRIINEFIELVSIDSISFQERQMADVLKNKLKELSVEVSEDHAGEHYQSQTGNIYGFLKGDLAGKPLLFSSHMDTVQPGLSKKAIQKENGKITSDGTTILGADDISGIVAILESIRVLQENHIPHRDIEVLFPIAEELYIKGSKVFDYKKIKSKEAYVLDLSGPIGTASLQEPTLISFSIEVIGKDAHAGFCPEKGIHSIWLASKAISQISQGRIDEETTVNIGTIHGGTATNIVPQSTIIEGEIRSYNHQKALKTLENIFNIFEKTVVKAKGKLKKEYEIHLEAYQVLKNEKVVKRYIEVCQQLHIPSCLTKTFGGSDNNSFMRHGIQGIVLACGMNQVHTTEEYTTVDDLEKSTAIVIGLMTSQE